MKRFTIASMLLISLFVAVLAVNPVSKIQAQSPENHEGHTTAPQQAPVAPAPAVEPTPAAPAAPVAPAAPAAETGGHEGHQAANANPHTLETLNVKVEFECNPSDLLCVGRQMGVASERLQILSPPPLDRDEKITYTYTTEFVGNITADKDEFKRQVNETLNDPRGWAYMNVEFKEVPSSGNFILTLADPQATAAFGGVCDSLTSCRLGDRAIINQDRWLQATPSWNASNLSIRDYRHLNVTHITGHWMGINRHFKCSGTGRPAAVMSAQSQDLEGCKFNAWPLLIEFNEANPTRKR
ncbi:hypothetical protein CYG49_00780 [Candidatus Saccharibacteria bacterium]|nr:MAG: hypothetical protein CYG49_00780 [Candidatus Saccharibacteria bacterium]